jgi:hypothetical protein
LQFGGGLGRGAGGGPGGAGFAGKVRHEIGAPESARVDPGHDLAFCKDTGRRAGLGRGRRWGEKMA